MRHETWWSAGLIGSAVVVGALSWSGQVQLLPLAMVFPALWSMAPSRLSAGLVSAGYFLAASRGLPEGVANFYRTGALYSYALLGAAALSFIGVYMVAWTPKSGWLRIVRFTIASILMSAPPFGIVGWAHPITAAGVLFPGWGWFGLAAAATGMLVMTTKRWPVAASALGGFWFWSVACWTPVSVPAGWAGVDTRLGESLGRRFDLDQHNLLVTAVGEEASRGSRVVVLPESAVGFWTPTVARFWHNKVQNLNITVVAGSAVLDAAGYDNVLVAMDRTDGRILYSQRMPVPVSMWQPWLRLSGQVGGARADFFSNPVVEVDGKRVAPLICYEQLIVWPILQSMLSSPDLVLAVGNSWWTSGTSIMAIQKASAEAWVQLFNTPIVFAFNT
jgi:hypothetical protein